MGEGWWTGRGCVGVNGGGQLEDGYWCHFASVRMTNLNYCGDILLWINNRRQSMICSTGILLSSLAIASTLTYYSRDSLMRPPKGLSPQVVVM